MQSEQEILLEHLAKDDDIAYTLLYKQFYVPMVLFASQYIKGRGAVVFYFHVGAEKEFRECYGVKSLSLSFGKKQVHELYSA